jgi:hypothetical protein
MAARVGQAICWIASLLTLSVGVLALAASIVALALFAFGVHLASQILNKKTKARFLGRAFFSLANTAKVRVRA